MTEEPPPTSPHLQEKKWILAVTESEFLSLLQGSFPVLFWRAFFYPTPLKSSWHQQYQCGGWFLNNNNNKKEGQTLLFLLLFRFSVQCCILCFFFFISWIFETSSSPPTPPVLGISQCLFTKNISRCCSHVFYSFLFFQPRATTLLIFSGASTSASS